MIMMKDHCVVWVGGLLLYFGHTLTPSTLLFGALLSCLPTVSQSPGYHGDTAPGYHRLPQTSFRIRSVSMVTRSCLLHSVTCC